MKPQRIPQPLLSGFRPGSRVLGELAGNLASSKADSHLADEPWRLDTLRPVIIGAADSPKGG